MTLFLLLKPLYNNSDFSAGNIVSSRFSQYSAFWQQCNLGVKWLIFFIVWEAFAFLQLSASRVHSFFFAVSRILLLTVTGWGRGSGFSFVHLFDPESWLLLSKLKVTFSSISQCMLKIKSLGDLLLILISQHFSLFTALVDSVFENLQNLFSMSTSKYFP